MASIRKRSLYQSFLKTAIRRRKKTRKNLLRDLPEEILQVIISQLTLKDAARMSTLSNMWRILWNSHSNLSFDGAMVTNSHAKRDTQEETQENKFIDMVNTVLHHHCGTNLKQFKVVFLLREKHASSLDSWIGFAVSSKASEIVLNLDPQQAHAAEDAYNFPFHLFQSENNIQSIWVKCVSLKPPRDFHGFAKLTKLTIFGVLVLEVEEMGNLLSNCCALKWLEINFCKFGKLKLHGTFHRLQHLCIMYSELQAIELHATDLMTFKYIGKVLPMTFEESHKLKIANIKWRPHYFGYVYSELSTALPELSTALPYLEDLYLDAFIEKQVPQRVSTMKFNHLRYLNCKVYIRCYGEVLRLASILKVAPVLEKFELHMENSRFGSRFVKVNGNPPSSPHKHLKIVLMTGFFGLEEQIELALFILENAQSLQSMTVDPFHARDKSRPEEVTARPYVHVGREYAHRFLDLEKYRDVLTIL